MNDQHTMLLRYTMIAVGSYLSGRFGIPLEQVGPIVDQILQLIGIAMTASAVISGIRAKWNTKTVSAATGARPDVQTLSPLTGKPE